MIIMWYILLQVTGRCPDGFAHPCYTMIIALKMYGFDSYVDWDSVNWYYILLVLPRFGVSVYCLDMLQPRYVIA